MESKKKFMLLLLILQLAYSGNFDIVQTQVFSNAIAEGITVKFQASNENYWLDDLLGPSQNEDSAGWFYIHTWDLKQDFDSVFSRQSGPFQIKSVKIGKWVKAENNGGDKVTVSSDQAQGWETFGFKKIGKDSIVIMKDDYYFTLLNGQMMAIEKNSSKAEIFKIRQIIRRLNRKINAVNLGSLLVVEK